MPGKNPYGRVQDVLPIDKLLGSRLRLKKQRLRRESNAQPPDSKIDGLLSICCFVSNVCNYKRKRWISVRSF